VWDAGCATGEEPFSLAMIFAERISYWDLPRLHIDATDIDESGSNQFREIIANGVYDTRAVDSVPPGLVERYFRKNGGGDLVEVDYRIRECVSFQRHDLLSLEPVGGDYDLIVCKNVLMHVSPDQQTEVVRMFHGCLRRDGILAMDQAQQVPEDLRAAFVPLSPRGCVFRRADASK
jgi:chemotaxis protein methyltransferase CheR